MKLRSWKCSNALALKKTRSCMVTVRVIWPMMVRACHLSLDFLVAAYLRVISSMHKLCWRLLLWPCSRALRFVFFFVSVWYHCQSCSVPVIHAADSRTVLGGRGLYESNPLNGGQFSGGMWPNRIGRVCMDMVDGLEPMTIYDYYRSQRHPEESLPYKKFQVGLCEEVTKCGRIIPKGTCFFSICMCSALLCAMLLSWMLLVFMFNLVWLCCVLGATGVDTGKTKPAPTSRKARREKYMKMKAEKLKKEGVKEEL